MNLDITQYHDGHDHGGDSNVTMNCGMSMSLHWRTCEPILVSSWKTDTTGKFVLACVLFFAMAFFYEALKYYRESMLIKSMQARRSGVVNKSSNGEGGSTIVTQTLTLKEQILSGVHVSQTFLHGLQVFISYILMLIVMLCNMYLIILICLGAALGYFVFGWMKKLPSCQDPNECCY